MTKDKKTEKVHTRFSSIHGTILILSKEDALVFMLFLEYIAYIQDQTDVYIAFRVFNNTDHLLIKGLPKELIGNIISYITNNS